MDKLAMCCGLLPGQQTAAEIWTAVAKSNQFNTAELETLRRDLGDADALRFGGDAAPIESIERVQYRLQGWLKRIENPVGGESS